MKIEDPRSVTSSQSPRGVVPANQAPARTEAQRAQNGQAVSQPAARVELSSRSREMHQALEVANASPDVRADKVNKLIAGPGYVLPGDVKSQLARSDTTWTLSTASADYDSFAPALKPSDADLTKFFSKLLSDFHCF